MKNIKSPTLSKISEELNKYLEGRNYTDKQRDGHLIMILANKIVELETIIQNRI